jgi:hypothetical protein
MVWSQKIWFWRHPDKLGRLGLHASNHPGFYRTCLDVFLKFKEVSATGRSGISVLIDKNKKKLSHMNMKKLVCLLLVQLAWIALFATTSRAEDLANRQSRVWHQLSANADHCCER